MFSGVFLVRIPAIDMKKCEHGHCLNAVDLDLSLLQLFGNLSISIYFHCLVLDTHALHALPD